ncbi:MAG: hypothetical protein ABWZ74_07495 [Hyphomicrobiaceae bacterium]|jgi:hypothetical protein
MRSRTHKAHRLVSVQAQIKRAEEWKLADIERRLAAGEAAQRELIAALNENHALYDLFIDTIARRLRALAEEASRTRDAKDAQARRLLACAGRLKTAERLAKAADAEMQGEIEKKDLLDLLESLVVHRGRKPPAS